MKLLFDLFPVIVFFISYKLAGIYVATGVAILATCAQIGWVHFRHGKVDKMLWASLVLIVVFGGMTLVLHDPTFIKWKPTILYWLFALTLLASAWLFGRNLMRSMLGQQMSLPDAVWRRLNLAWAGFFALMGALNLYVAYAFSEEAWVNFKLFGSLGLMLVFVVLQGMMLAKYIEDKEP